MKPITKGFHRHYLSQSMGKLLPFAFDDQRRVSMLDLGNSKIERKKTRYRAMLDTKQDTKIKKTLCFPPSYSLGTPKLLLTPLPYHPIGPSFSLKNTSTRSDPPLPRGFRLGKEESRLSVEVLGWEQNCETFLQENSKCLGRQRFDAAFRWDKPLAAVALGGGVGPWGGGLALEDWKSHRRLKSSNVALPGNCCGFWCKCVGDFGQTQEFRFWVMLDFLVKCCCLLILLICYFI